jgi:hypothetical protein
MDGGSFLSNNGFFHIWYALYAFCYRICNVCFQGMEMTDNYVPIWACSQWGQYEHDWLDCPECNEAYEKYLEEGEMTFHEKLMYLRGLSAAYFTVEDLGTLLFNPVNLVQHEYEEYVCKIEEFYEKRKVAVLGSHTSIEKFFGKIQEAK